MKITDVTFSVLKPRKTLTFGVTTYPVQYGVCRVTTDEGVEGDYITSGWIDPYLLANQLGVIKADIIGRDSFDREKIEKKISRKWRMGHALAVLDMCLWDIAGKATGLPVYKLLGAQKDKVMAYACVWGRPLNYNFQASRSRLLVFR